MKDLFFDVMMYETLFCTVFVEMIACSRLEAIFHGAMIWHVARILAWHCSF